MELNKKTVFTLITTLLIFLAFYLKPSLSDLIVESKTNLDNSISKNEKDEIKCGSSFSKIPDELKDLFQKQTNSFEDVNFPSDKFASLKNELDFYGYTYSVYGSSSDDIKSKCSDQNLKREKITFVSKNINEIIRMYISAVIFNETTVFKAQSNAVENNSKLSKINELRLCMNSQCGLENSSREFKSFDYINLADIKYARTFSDSFLFINTIDELKTFTDESVETSKLNDSQIAQMLTQARIIAYTKADEINK